jgi:hypothetical protein
MRGHINHLEIERAELLHRLALTQEGADEIAKRSENIAGQISTREHHVQILDQDNRAL